MSHIGKIFHYKDSKEHSNGHYCIVVAESLTEGVVIGVRVTSKPRVLPRTQNAVHIIKLADVIRIFPKSMYGNGNPDWHKESRIYFADSVYVHIKDISFRQNLCPKDILTAIIDEINDAWPYVVRTEFMRYFIKA